MKMEYVLGFMFDPSLNRVVLIRKNRPEAQKNRYNGIGGKIEKGEVPLQAMEREFWEETGLAANRENNIYWDQIGILHGRQKYTENEWIVNVFTTISPSSKIFEEVFSKTDENVEIHYIDALPETCMGNIYWLVPAALAKFRDREFESFVANYTLE